MRKRRRQFELFNLSFLDIISCGFGAVILLVLISTYFQESSPGNEQTILKLLQDVMRADASVKVLEVEVGKINDELSSKHILAKKLEEMAAKSQSEMEAITGKSKNLEEDVAGLELVLNSLDMSRRASTSHKTVTERDKEVGGIPVNSEYVVFIVDTSGSMQQIWGRVTRELENIIRIHPKIKGFQILNDNGAHLLSGYDGRWIPDTPGRRESVIGLFKNWASFSNSSPVEGLEVALRRYAKRSENVSIYIFGDEYSGSSYDPVIEALINSNTDRTTGERLAQVHAVGFLSQYSTGRFATLMREVTRQTNGTFIALPR